MINQIAKATEKLFGWLGIKSKNLSKRQAYRRIDRLEAAVEAAENYIRVNDKSGEFNNISNNRKEQLLRHYSKRFFHYN